MPAAEAELTPLVVAQWLSDALGSPYRFVGRFVGGESGAFELRGPDDETLALKWSTSPSAFAARAHAVELTDRLRTLAGWPVPQQRIVELTLDGRLVDERDPTRSDGERCQVILQEVLPGRPVEVLTSTIADELTALLATSRSLGLPEEAGGLEERIVETLVDGGAGYCLHEPMRRYDTRTRRLVERFEEIGRALHGLAITDDPTDIVHYDLHLGNVLAADGHVCGIIDTEYAIVGDGGFDLVALTVCAPEHAPQPGVESALWERVDRDVAEPWRTAYIAHLMLRNIDWAIRNHGADDVELWLAEAARRLPG